MTEPLSSLHPHSKPDARFRPRLLALLATTPTWVIALVLGIIAWSAPNDNTRSDPWLTLATSAALLQHGSPKLDGFADSLLVRADAPTWTWVSEAGHTYNRYPIGPSVLALPVVAIARAAGLDLRDRVIDRHLQRALAALVVAGIFLLLHRMAAAFTTPGAARVSAFVAVAGTSLVSTLATALWNQGPGTLFATGALGVLALRAAHRTVPTFRDAAVCGLLLGVAWTCRPTAIVPAFACAAHLAFVRSRALPAFLLGGAAVAAVFVGFWTIEIGAPLPNYYRPTTWPAGESPMIGLAGILVSPGRGWLTFSPIVALAAVGWLLRDVRRHPLFLTCWIWILGIIALVSRQSDWWGGWSYGPRLLTDAVPAAFVAFLLVLSDPAWRRAFSASRFARRAVASAVGFSVAVHLGQGLLNASTWDWNGSPNVNDVPREKIFDWRNPQFLATPGRVRSATQRWELRQRESPPDGR